MATVVKPIMRCTVTALICVAVSTAGADPNFTGTWKLNAEISEVRPSPAQASEELKIDHQGARIRCVAALKPGEGPTSWDYVIDGKEGKAKVAGRMLRSILKWEGAALVINTLVTAPEGDYTQMDRWRLSRDGKTLTIRRQIVRLHGETELTLVYNKQ